MNRDNRPGMPVIFVCSPYRGDTETNVKNAQKYCRLVIQQGGIPFAPHLLFTQILDDDSEGERQLGMYMGTEMLKLCDELWAFGSPSSGMLNEIQMAEQLGVPVKRFDMKEGVVCE